MTDDEPVVGGRYQLGEVLGRGGMAEVRRGVDLRLGRAVAIKRLSPQLAADPTFQERFRREAQAAASLNHQTIAAVYDSGEESDPATGIDIPYIVMELVAGQTLRDVLRSGGTIPPERALALTQGVLDALEHSHAAGIIHRDIKPANVMLTPDGGVKVMDFGIARAATDTSASLTQTAAVIGTAQYLSPEQARGESVDLRSDIYSTGCLLYELLVGRPPFVGETSVSVAYQHVREAPAPPSRLDPALSPDIDAVTLKALAKDPADRYQTANEMRADLGRVLAGGAAAATLPLGPAAAEAEAALATRVQPTAVRPAAVKPPTGPPPVALVDEPEPGRSRGRAVLIAALAFLVLAGAVFGLFQAFGPSAAASVSIPDVKGASKAEADAQLRDAGLVAVFRDVEGKEDDTVGTVLSVDPAGGTTVPSGSEVVLEVNVGPMDAEIPDLEGEDVDDAEKILAKAGFTRVRTEEADDPPEDADEGEVVSVDPDEGSSVALGQEITLSYVGDRAESTTAPATTAPTRSTSQESDEPEETSEPAEPTETEEQTDEPTDDPTTREPTATATAEPTQSSRPTSTPKASASAKAKATKAVRATKPPKATKTPKARGRGPATPKP